MNERVRISFMRDYLLWFKAYEVAEVLTHEQVQEIFGDRSESAVRESEEILIKPKPYRVHGSSLIRRIFSIIERGIKLANLPSDPISESWREAAKDLKLTPATRTVAWYHLNQRTHDLFRSANPGQLIQEAYEELNT